MTEIGSSSGKYLFMQNYLLWSHLYTDVMLCQYRQVLDTEMLPVGPGLSDKTVIQMIQVRLVLRSGTQEQQHMVT